MTTYKRSGVDLEAADAFVERVTASVTDTWRNDVVTPWGSFAAGIRMPDGYSNPVLCMTTDGVGTKLALAALTDRLDGIGFDLVAMCVDDLAAIGSRPLAVTDYLAVGRLNPSREARIVRGIAEACRAAGCVLAGGETAEHPGVLPSDGIDVAGAALGIVENGRQVTGDAIAVGDLLLGISSPNVRSNGFSLIRSALSEHDLNQPLPGMEQPAADALLEPSVIYAPAVVALVESVRPHGLAHITGGGLRRGVSRMLNSRCDAVIDRGSWPIPTVFRSISNVGDISDAEMERTFNMGVGFVVAVAPSDTQAAISALSPHQVFEIGHIEQGTGIVHFR